MYGLKDYISYTNLYGHKFIGCGQMEGVMRRKGIVFGISLWLAGAVFISSGMVGSFLQTGGGGVVSVKAGKATVKDIQKQIDETQRKRKSIQQEKEELERDIVELEEKKGNILEYIKTLDDKLSSLSDKIEANEEEIVILEEQIRELREKKRKAEVERKRQYDTMASRIKYMYENGNDSYFELLFGAGSLSELFNRVEYVNKVTSYDREMLGKYQKICDNIQKTEKKLTAKLGDLNSVKESLKLKKNSVNALMDKKTEQLKSYESEIDAKNEEAEERENLIRKQEEEMEKLFEAQRKEVERERAEAAKKQDDIANRTGIPEGIIDQNTGGYQWPLAVSGRISSYFGYRDAPTAGASTYHKGIDIAVPSGTNVLAAQAGTVVTASYSASAGNYIAIYHGNGTYTYYMHCSKLKVSARSEVSKGQSIALSGNTGISTGPHLHFAVYANGAYVNPLKYVSVK